jgi:hypothetical protein
MFTHIHRLLSLGGEPEDQVQHDVRGLTKNETTPLAVGKLAGIWVRVAGLLTTAHTVGGGGLSAKQLKAEAYLSNLFRAGQQGKFRVGHTPERTSLDEEADGDAVKPAVFTKVVSARSKIRPLMHMMGLSRPIKKGASHST